MTTNDHQILVAYKFAQDVALQKDLTLEVTFLTIEIRTLESGELVNTTQSLAELFKIIGEY